MTWLWFIGGMALGGAIVFAILAYFFIAAFSDGGRW